MLSARDGGRGGEESLRLDLRLAIKSGRLVDAVDECLDSGLGVGSKNGSSIVVISSFGKVVAGSSMSSFSISSLKGDARPLRVEAVESVRISGRGPNR